MCGPGLWSGRAAVPPTASVGAFASGMLRFSEKHTGTKGNALLAVQRVLRVLYSLQPYSVASTSRKISETLM